MLFNQELYIFHYIDSFLSTKISCVNAKFGSVFATNYCELWAREKVFGIWISLLRIRMLERTKGSPSKPHPDVRLVPPLPLGAFRRHISALPPSQDIDFIVALVSRCSAVFQYFHQLSPLSIHFFYYSMFWVRVIMIADLFLSIKGWFTTQRADRK